ncbi:tetratricopeptide repeat protein [Oceanicoccus sagamiensis]|uniref:Uncharacterized protein n=1 Tax=Oceanicoccus sagamiensis TaxID=716816 RepID=A0A1X9NDX2_9GAMM|nr:tetratricopeptide repeat protein [Oceanicoccus sagamiensis]ARN75756.1 hypothetical protein BST96_17570 [Oceanicoccus sagamiensis]
MRFSFTAVAVSLLLTVFSLFTHATPVNDANFVGSQQCASCHQQAYKDWQGSHHDQAMMMADSTSVLGDFNQATFSLNGITSTFFKKGDEFWVNTDGADGKLQDFKIDYTFGVTPLQQYLIGFEDGRYQTLSIAWDSRSKEEGGQRWFHLYPDIGGHEDVLHWTRYSQNWNSRCAECHSTNLKKNYDEASNSYQTTWFEIDVACESCHGAGSQHIDWVNNKDQQANIANKGLLADVRSDGHWQRLPGLNTAAKQGATRAHSDQQINSCAGCHSRRSTIGEVDHKTVQGKEVLDTHIPRLIESPLYHVDGQILDEVYVYGSFVQSKMYQRGVVCSDCHNPHSLELKAPDNQVCAQCHNPSVFDQPQHHHHSDGSAGALCADCHMPETTYMTVDPRRDHSLRIPRPDLSKSLGVPNACNQCHSDKDSDWALAAFTQWYPDRIEQPSFAPLIYAGQQGAAQALPQLSSLVDDSAMPIMVRASGLQILRNYPNQYAINTALLQLESSNPQLRLAAIEVIELLPEQQIIRNVWPLMSDPVKAIRMEAARLLAPMLVSRSVALQPAQKQTVQKAVDEYIASIKLNADTPAGQMQLGVVYQSINQWALSEQAYRQALVIEPQYIPALLNMADLYRATGQDQQALPLLEKALLIDSNNVSANYAMGLLMIRLKQLDKATAYLEVAASQAPEIIRYTYVYAVALFESGKRDWAITTLKRALQRSPGNTDILSALAGYLQMMGRNEEAQQYSVQLPQNNQ